MRIIKIWRICFPSAEATFYAFSQNKANSTRNLFSKNHGDAVVDVILAPVDPCVPVDTSLDPSSYVVYQRGVTLPYVDSDGLIHDTQGFLSKWKSRGWDGTVEEVTA